MPWWYRVDLLKSVHSCKFVTRGVVHTHVLKKVFKYLLLQQLVYMCGHMYMYVRHRIYKECSHHHNYTCNNISHVCVYTWYWCVHERNRSCTPVCSTHMHYKGWSLLCCTSRFQHSNDCLVSKLFRNRKSCACF